MALIGALIIELLCSSVSGRGAELSEAGMKNVLQKRLFSRLFTASWNGREIFHSGDMLSRLTEDCRVVAECLCRTVLMVITALFQLAGAFLFLWYFSHTLALILILVLPVFIFAGKIFYHKIQILTQHIRKVESRLQERMQESLQHRLLLLSCRRTLSTIEAVADLHRTRYNFLRRRTDIIIFSRTAVFSGFEAGYLSAFLWGISGLKNGTISFGMMTAYLQLAGQIQRPMAELARLTPSLIHSHTAFSRLADIERLPVEDENEAEAEGTEITSSPFGITFRNVTFTYPGVQQPVFRQFNYTFTPGSHTAIMGMTGTGKSTLLRLILAFLRPQEGEVELFYMKDGKKHTFPVSASTRRRIVYVSQGNSLLSGTIRDNLLIGDPAATESEMYDALHAAAADFVADLPAGMDTVCGERGGGLSEGQAQRIAIARALLCPGSILLLDEISASLDEATETLLMQRLMEKRPSHTVLLVTHRSGVLPYCDTTLRVVSH